MSLKAFGAYITRLRKEEKLSRLALSKLAGTSDSNLMRIEQGNQEAGAILLALIAKNVKANFEDIVHLLLLENDNEDVGVQKAEEEINRRRDAINNSNNIHPDVMVLVSRMSEYELGRWVSMGEILLEERSKQK